MYHSRQAEIQDRELTSAQAEVTFARISQWEPFMEMGNRPGQMVFHAAGRKLEGGADGLRDVNRSLHEFIGTTDKKYLRAPGAWQPGTVSQWDAFKQLKIDESQNDETRK